ncbi:hypothetical protein V6N12_023640 [Hibiscus sabdariffa]|uniref:Uncharacterized protein n=1 Tax=Hibiscus sabdariffa TaxID=183260 RepID=A0ABR2FYE7_9ROSI
MEAFELNMLPESCVSEILGGCRTHNYKLVRNQWQNQIQKAFSKHRIRSLSATKKFTERSYGLDLIPSETSVGIRNQTSKNTAYLRCQDTKKQQVETLFYSNRKQMMKSRVIEGEDRVMRKRDDGWMDGWMEIELGEFFNGGIKDKRSGN